MSRHTRPHAPLLMRRRLLQIGGLSLVGGFINGFRPSNVFAAAGKAAPRATARQVLFINLTGGMSQVDTLDAKHSPSTPDYFDIRAASNGLMLPHGIMPNIASIVDRLTVVRSMAAWDPVHGRAQYYIQTGHPLNLAFAKEVPAIGAVVCYELAGQRRPTDSLPPYISMNMAGNQAGLINQGFLPATVGPLNLSISKAAPELAPRPGSAEALQRRYARLQQADASLRTPSPQSDRAYADFHDYYKGAWDILNDPRVPAIFTIDDADRARYGDTTLGNQLLLARNLFAADAGTRFILVSHDGWDHHGDIYKENTRNHVTLIRELDAAYTQLIKDLESTPSPHDPARTLLDETLVVCMSEFGRTPGPISETRAGREHHIHAHSGMFAGGGIQRGAILGSTDAIGDRVADPGWSAGRPIYMEDVAATIYSALGIDWTKRLYNTPSGRTFHYIESASAADYIAFKPVDELFA